MVLLNNPTDAVRPALYSPEWWVDRLSLQLDTRLKPMVITTNAKGPSVRIVDVPRDGDMLRWQRYYDGRLNLALASAKWRAEFESRFPHYTANFMEMVVDKHRERLQVQGIRYGDSPAADTEAWDWWQENHLDAESLKLHREMLVKSACYALVWPNEDGVPEVSIESPEEVIVETAPGKAWKRLAALKRFLGVDDFLHAELFLPEGVYKYRSAQRNSDFSLSDQWHRLARWQPEKIDGEEWPIENPVGVVPVVPFIHKPDLRNRGTSKIMPVASNQDAINKYRVDAFVASEFASFRQRWVIGLDIPTDPETGKAIEPFRSAVDRLWTVPPPDPDDYPDSSKAPEVKFGEFDISPLDPFYTSIVGEIRMLGTISKIPMHQLLPQTGQPASAEAILADESGLIAEVIDDMTNIGESWEEVFRLNFAFRGDERGQAPGAEVIWRNPAVQSESAHIDALVKMKALSVPDLALWELMQGVTQKTIRRWQALAAQQALEVAAALPEPPDVPDAGPTA